MSKSNCQRTVDYLCHIERDKVRFKLEHRKFGSVENFVAKLSVSFHAKNLEVDVTTCVQA